VLQLGSAAALGERFYVRDEIRRESPDEALEIERAIGGVWGGHPGYRFLPACEEYEQKYAAFVSLVVSLISKSGLDNRPATASLP
jgi:hypothetical protein